MRKLSRREAILIFFLGLILVVGVGIFSWLLPLRASVDILKVENENLLGRVNQMQYLVERKPEVAIRKNLAERDVQASLNLMSDQIIPEVFDAYLQGLASKHGLKLIEVLYGDAEAGSPSADSMSKNEQLYNLKEWMDEYLKIQSERPKTPIVTSHEVLKRTIKISMQGTTSNTYDFIDGLNQDLKTGFITSYVFDGKNGTQLFLDIYYLDKVQSSE